MGSIIYKPEGVCAQQIAIEVAGGVVVRVEFMRGCSGNTMGISRLVEGMRVVDVIERLSGIDCKGRGTSCPDQLSRALGDFL